MLSQWAADARAASSRALRITVLTPSTCSLRVTPEDRTRSIAALPRHAMSRSSALSASALPRAPM